MMTQFADLLADNGGPCISLYMPTERGFADKPHNPTRFHNLLRTAERGLPTTLDEAARESLLAPLFALADNDLFWRHTLQGLAVMRAPNYYKVYKLQHTVSELAMVADSFHVKPLLRLTQSADRYEVLALTRDHVRLFQGNRDTLHEIELDPGVPRSLEAALGDQVTEPHASARVVFTGGATGGKSAVQYGIGSRSDEIDKDTTRYFRAVDRAILEHHSKRSQLPLVLAALPEHHATFREVSHNAHLLADGIAGNPDAFTLEQLREKAWQLVEPSIERQVQQQLDEYGAALPRQLASDDYADVAMAALAGRVKSLLVDADRVVAGTVDRSSGKVTLGDMRDPHTDDIIDDLAELTLRNGGAVSVLPHERVPGITGVAATYRF